MGNRVTITPLEVVEDLPMEEDIALNPSNQPLVNPLQLPNPLQPPTDGNNSAQPRITAIRRLISWMRKNIASRFA